eukprot:CAMPEP_0172488052 /NCGR_PEP_ID=MMETSP1066-20121228/17403_1 /TAXON_ID=671091 /ORGANISM="Coscinodiscus wailesii, Strain CCMP2513" /LENGTH=895 /DNA_ID=CAMNT_0013255033 /DNA_START=317 /DNA_END=3004 /DNA_ORIENTATION=+
MGTKPHPDGTGGVQTVAIKAITRSTEKLTKKLLENLEMEIAILRTYRHPNIVCMHDVVKTDKHFFLILEYCGGGDVQRLIRSRKSGRLSERLTRRLMRDLTAGLKFLWSQELIHRDLKPQNLLLTGVLPLDEGGDPCQSEAEEEHRRKINFPSAEFALKIADFGFARHLQTTSLAETLCGSPLYMAPEILQHHRYDAKADLWSVGTVLFEMIAGRPPFHGENHIDLLRNIQRRAVRLPPGVKVSPQCVNLLRLLLNRNPLSRAGFQQYFEASDAFVALGCNGPHGDGKDQGSKLSVSAATPDADLRPGRHRSERMRPMVVSRHDGAPPSTSTTSNSHVNTIPPVTIPPQTQIKSMQKQQQNQHQAQISGIVTRQYSHFTPLAPSPPGPQSKSKTSLPSGIPFPPALDIGAACKPQQYLPVQIPLLSQTPRDIPEATPPPQQRQTAVSQTFVEENDFVLVERDSRSRSVSPSPSQLGLTHSGERSSSSRYARRVYPIDNKSPTRPLQMLSTSPNTGRALVTTMMAPQNQSQNPLQKDDRELAVKMLAAAEDVGRRAVNIAHLGDTRAYIGMKLMMAQQDGGSSLLSSSPMEGVIEEEEDERMSAPEDLQNRSNHSNRSSIKASLPLEPLPEEDDDDEMPFAFAPVTPAPCTLKPIISAANSSITHSNSKPSRSITIGMIHAHFREALSCYIKALSLMKGALKAAQRVMEVVETTTDRHFLERCELSLNWLSTQFQGVLERADAANHELRKAPSPSATTDDANTNTTNTTHQEPTTSVEELIYNHSLSCGRDGAVKQLLGQYDAARACYRSAGLLAESLLMESRITDDDRHTLQGYVDGFAERIKELDALLSRSGSARAIKGSGTGSAPGKGGIVGLVMPPHHLKEIPPPFVLDKRR